MFQLRIAQIGATFMAPCYKLPLVIDLSVLHLLLLAVTGWLDRRERRRFAYLRRRGLRHE
jgi:hypothetical protein